MEQRLIDKVAIVIGSGHGIGKSVALRLSREGADIIVADVDIESAEQTAQEILDAGQKVTAYFIDLADISQIQPISLQSTGQEQRLIPNLMLYMALLDMKHLKIL